MKIEKKMAKNGASLYYVNGKRSSCDAAIKVNGILAKKILCDLTSKIQGNGFTTQLFRY